MKSLKEVSVGLISGILTSLIVLGAILVAMTEGLVSAVPTAQPEVTLPVFQETPLPGEPSSTPIPTLRPVMVTPTPTSSCTAVPQGWERYRIQPGDKLSDLAAQRGVSESDIIAGNCLSGPFLVEGAFLALPPLPTSTPTPTLTFTPSSSATFKPTLTIAACGPPAGWVVYVVQPGDNLFRLSLEVNRPQQEVMLANCMFGNDTTLRAGQRLYLPFLPPSPTGTLTPQPSNTPVRSSTPTRTRTPSRTPTPTPVTPSVTPVTPSVTPVTPSVTPVTPSPTPEPPSPTPVTPSPTPETPSPTPVTPSPTPEPPSATPETPTETPSQIQSPTSTPLTPAANRVVSIDSGGDKANSGILSAMSYPITLFFGTFIPVFAP